MATTVKNQSSEARMDLGQDLMEGLFSFFRGLIVFKAVGCTFKYLLHLQSQHGVFAVVRGCLMVNAYKYLR